MLHTGVDLIEVHRIKQAVERQGARFLRRIYTAKELALFGDNYPSLAARFAAKEAVAKALGTGIGEVEWTDIEILHGPQKQPVLHLHDAAKKASARLRISQWSLSLSHTHEHAIAFVVALAAE
ncbi:MAG: holo-ACP synthase [Anaerolineae bacterium]|nr:holo-ACP synthase [Anaerolineae bacterium]